MHEEQEEPYASSPLFLVTESKERRTPMTNHYMFSRLAAWG
jgi:hypothetical protein